MKARFYTLKNGLTVILSANHKDPRIAFCLAVRSGSNSDPKNHTGLAHYLEHILFKGTAKIGSANWAKEQPLLDKIEALYEKYGAITDKDKRKEAYKEIDSISGEAAKFGIAGEYPKLMKALGSQGTNADTFVEETVYEEDIPANAIVPFLAVQAERFRNPVIRYFHTELEAVYEEKNRGLDNDGNKMQDAMFEAAFPTHNYGLQSTIGTIEHLKNPSIKAIKEFYGKNYVPNNMAVILSGDFEPNEIIGKVDSAFAYLQPKPVDEYKAAALQPIEKIIVKEVYGPSAEQVRVVYRTPAAGTRQAFLANLSASILSNGNAGLMDIALIKQQKLLNAQAQAWQFKDYGIFVTIAVPKEGQSLDEAKSLLLEQIDSLKKGGFDEALIKAIAANNRLNLLYGLKDNTNRAGALTDAFIKSKGNGWNKNVSETDEMTTVTKKELMDFANNFFTDSNYIVVYKRKGIDSTIAKVDKPAITPVTTNEDKTSPYVQAVMAARLPSFKPVWLNYAKDIQRAKISSTDILYVQNKDNSLFTLTYNFNTGSWNNKLLPVAADYINYLGTDKYSSAAISKAFYQLACGFYISVQREQTIISVYGLQENFDKAVKLFEGLIAGCKPDEQALANLKSGLQKERADAKLSKGNIAQALQAYASYGEKNPFNYKLSDDGLQKMEASNLIGILHSLEKHQHLITYYGPLQQAVLTQKIKVLHPLPSGLMAEDSAVKFERTTQTSNHVLFADYDAVQSEVYWVKNLEKYDPASEGVANVFSNYFGGGFGSIVFNEIRGSKALAYSTYAVTRQPSKKGDNMSQLAYVGCQADKMNDAINAMNGLLDSMPENKDGFDNTKISLIKNIETERIAGEDIIASYLAAKKMGLNYDIRKENYGKYKTMQFTSINQFHDKYLSHQPFTYCIIGSDKKISADDLKKYGILKVVSLKELFGY